MSDTKPAGVGARVLRESSREHSEQASKPCGGFVRLCYGVYRKRRPRVSPYLSHLLHQISRCSSITAASSRRKDVQMPRRRSATFTSTPSSTKYLLPHPPTAHSKRSHLLCRAHGLHRQAAHSSTPPRCNASLTPPLIARPPITAPFTPRARISGVTARRSVTWHGAPRHPQVPITRGRPSGGTAHRPLLRAAQVTRHQDSRFPLHSDLTTWSCQPSLA